MTGRKYGKRSLGRRSLLLAPARRDVQRYEYFHPTLEPLEDRKMLATLYYNDDWTNETNPGAPPVAGNSVGHLTDFGGITGLTYGTDAFGLETVSGDGSFPSIKDAIDAAADNDTVLVGTGTHTQSDIVIDHPLVLKGEGQGNTIIVPEVASSNTSGDFAADTHSGIIIQMDPGHVWNVGDGDGVTVMDLTLDGGSGTFSDRDFHHGITTLYKTPGGPTVRNGTLTSTQWGGPGIHGTNETVPNIHIDSVTVKNTFWQGITISAKEDQAYDTGNGEPLALNVFNSTVENVGDVKDTNRIGILLQNVNDNQTGTLGNLISNTVSNTGVGIKMAPFGTISFFNQNGANNGAQAVINNVDDADVFGIWIQDGREEGTNANIITGGSPSGIGLFLDHARADGLTGTIVTGYGTGVLVQNSSFAENVTPYFEVGDLTGPGTGVVGSVGILVNNGGNDYESILEVAAAVTVSGYETGIKVEQTFIHADENLLQLDRPILTGNGTDLVVGDNSRVVGNFGFSTFEDVSVTGTGILDPRGTNDFNFDGDGPDFYINSTQVSPPNPTPPTPSPDKADTQKAANITLGSGATFNPVLTGETGGETTLWDFNNTVVYPGVPFPPLNWDHTLISPQSPYGALTDWGGQVFQNNGATLEVAGTANNGTGLSFLYGGKFDNSANASIYVAVPTDLTGRTHMNLDLKLSPDNAAKLLQFGLTDSRGNTESWVIPTSILNTSAFTTVTINLIAPSIELTDNDGGPDPDDVGINLSEIVGYVFGGDQGVGTNPFNQAIPLRFSVDNYSHTSQKSSMLEVSGSIDLGGATLAGNVRTGFTPGAIEEFTIVNNTSGGPVTGTFAGLPEGGLLSIDGNNFGISYTGGDGNDVVLTAIVGDPALVGRHLFYNNSKYDGNTPGIVPPTGGVNNDDSEAIATDKSAYLPGGGLITPASVSTYSRGINGIMVDIAGPTGTLSLADFEFAMSGQGGSVNNTPSTWVAAPAPTGFSVLADTPVAGTDRVTFIWPDNAIENRYLEVTVKGNDFSGGFNTNTGFAASDFFYYGNRIGDDFLSTPPVTFNTTAADEIDARTNPGFLQPLTNIYDYNKDSLISAADQIIARNNAGFQFKVNITGPPPPAPGGPQTGPSDDSDSGAASAVASALAIPEAASLLESSAPVESRPSGIDAGGRRDGAPARLLENADGVAAVVLSAANEAADDLDLDEALLELLAGRRE